MVPDLGQVSFDVAFGGTIYAIVNSELLGVGLKPQNFKTVADYGQVLKRAILQLLKIEYPQNKELGSLFGMLFIYPANNASNHSRLVNVFADGIVGRSTTGTGVGAIAALLFAKGALEMNKTVSVESIPGTTMTLRIVDDDFW